MTPDEGLHSTWSASLRRDDTVTTVQRGCHQSTGPRAQRTAGLGVPDWWPPRAAEEARAKAIKDGALVEFRQVVPARLVSPLATQPAQATS